MGLSLVAAALGEAFAIEHRRSVLEFKCGTHPSAEMHLALGVWMVEELRL